jgi:chloramphenicol O-acetyltransferase
MPLSLQRHHGSLDGLHIGRYFAGIDHYLHHPKEFLA